MIEQLTIKCGEGGVCALLSVEQWRVQGWRANHPRAYLRPDQRKLIWLIHCLVFHPEKLRSIFDVMSFGRYLVPDPPKVRYPKRKRN